MKTDRQINSQIVGQRERKREKVRNRETGVRTETGQDDEIVRI